MTEIDIEGKVNNILEDSERLERLLALEKERRGVPQGNLVFVAMSNVANHWWCTQQAVFKNRANEIGFFSAYLHDRIVHAHRLGLIDKLPRSNEALLTIGDEITLADVEGPLKTEKKARASSPGSRGGHVGIEDKEGKIRWYFSPDLPP